MPLRWVPRLLRWLPLQHAVHLPVWHLPQLMAIPTCPLLLLQQQGWPLPLPGPAWLALRPVCHLPCACRAGPQRGCQRQAGQSRRLSPRRRRLALLARHHLRWPWAPEGCPLQEQCQDGQAVSLRACCCWAAALRQQSQCRQCLVMGSACHAPLSRACSAAPGSTHRAPVMALEQEPSAEQSIGTHHSSITDK